MNGMQMIELAIERIVYDGQACALSQDGQIIILTDFRACAGTAVSFSAMTVLDDLSIKEWTFKADEDKMYEMFKSVA